MAGVLWRKADEALTTKILNLAQQAVAVDYKQLLKGASEITKAWPVQARLKKFT